MKISYIIKSLSILLFFVCTQTNAMHTQEQKEKKMEEVQPVEEGSALFNITILRCGHVFAIEDIKEWKESEINTCPVCGEEIDLESLIDQISQ